MICSFFSTFEIAALQHLLMSSGRRPRKKNTAVDFVASQYDKHYSHAIIRSLTTQFGVKESLKILQACSDNLKDYHRSIAAFPNQANMRFLDHYTENIRYIQQYVVDQYPRSKAVEAFYLECEKQKKMHLNPSRNTVTEIAALQESHRNDKDALAIQYNYYVFRLTYILAFVRGIEEYEQIISEINGQFRSGSLLEVLSDDQRVMTPRQIHKNFALAHMITGILRGCIGAKATDRMLMECRVALEKSMDRLDHAGARYDAIAIAQADSAFYIDY